MGRCNACVALQRRTGLCDHVPCVIGFGDLGDTGLLHQGARQHVSDA
jgi:hypothetical protein